MSEKLTRKKQLIFAKDTPDVLGNGTSVFGSVAQGNVQFSKDVDVLQSNKWQQGLAASTIEKTGGSGVPVMEDFNTIWYTLSRNLAYLYQQGLAEWDANQTYFTGNFVAKNSIMYISLTDNNINHDPANDTTNWSRYSYRFLADKLVAGNNIRIDETTNTISCINTTTPFVDFSNLLETINITRNTTQQTYTASQDCCAFIQMSLTNCKVIIKINDEIISQEKQIGDTTDVSNYTFPVYLANGYNLSIEKQLIDSGSGTGVIKIYPLGVQSIIPTPTPTPTPSTDLSSSFISGGGSSAYLVQDNKIYRRKATGNDGGSFGNAPVLSFNDVSNFSNDFTVEFSTSISSDRNQAGSWDFTKELLAIHFSGDNTYTALFLYMFNTSETNPRTLELSYYDNRNSDVLKGFASFTAQADFLNNKNFKKIKLQFSANTVSLFVNDVACATTLSANFASSLAFLSGKTFSLRFPTLFAYQAIYANTLDSSNQPITNVGDVWDFTNATMTNNSITYNLKV